MRIRAGLLLHQKQKRKTTKGIVSSIVATQMSLWQLYLHLIHGKICCKLQRSEETKEYWDWKKVWKMANSQSSNIIYSCLQGKCKKESPAVPLVSCYLETSWSVSIKNHKRPKRCSRNQKHHHFNFYQPITPGKELISLTSGLSPSDEVISDLLSAKSKGESALKEFVQERLVDQRIGFFKPLSRLNLDSFTKLKTTEVKWFNSVSKDLSMVKLQ